MDDPEILYQLLLQLDLEDIKPVCESSKVSQRICNSESFWREKYESAEMTLLVPQPDLVSYLVDFKYSRDCQHNSLRYLSHLKNPTIAKHRIIVFECIRPNDLQVPDVDQKQLARFLAFNRKDGNDYLNCQIRPDLNTSRLSLICFTIDNNGQEWKLEFPLSDSSALQILFIAYYYQYNNLRIASAQELDYSGVPDFPIN